MRIAYFDCFAGVSGNMILGALLSAGLPQTDLEADLAALNLPGWQLRVSAGVRKSIAGTHVEVDQIHHEHAHRTIRDIEQIVSAAQLPQPVRDQAMQVFERIAKAEGRVHGIPDTEVHFHEVGAIDSIVDIVGGIAGLHRLQLDAIWASAIHVGSGFIHTAHGHIPVPAPATLEILQGVPVYATDVNGELATPTGAAILRTVVSEFGPWPKLVVEKIGYGLGTKDFAIPNVLRLAIGQLSDTKALVSQTPVELVIPRGHTHAHGESHDHSHMNEVEHAHDDIQEGEHQHEGEHGPEHEHDCLTVLEANLDDMNPEFSQYILNALLEAGAVDAFYTPIVMKKGRPALKLTALCPPECVAACQTTIFRETTTLGIRKYQVSRTKLLRSWTEALVQDQAVRVKVGSLGRMVVNLAPEHDDCARVARATGLPLKVVYEQAKAAATEVWCEVQPGKTNPGVQGGA